MIIKSMESIPDLSLRNLEAIKRIKCNRRNRRECLCGTHTLRGTIKRGDESLDSVIKESKNMPCQSVTVVGIFYSDPLSVHLVLLSCHYF